MDIMLVEQIIVSALQHSRSNNVFLYIQPLHLYNAEHCKTKSIVHTVKIHKFSNPSRVCLNPFFYVFEFDHSYWSSIVST